MKINLTKNKMIKKNNMKKMNIQKKNKKLLKPKKQKRIKKKMSSQNLRSLWMILIKGKLTLKKRNLMMNRKNNKIFNKRIKMKTKNQEKTQYLMK